MENGPIDISDEFAESMEEWKQAMIKLLSVANRHTGKKWHYLEVMYSPDGEVCGVKLYGNPEFPEEAGTFH